MFYKPTDSHMSHSFSRHVMRRLALTGMVLCVVLIVGCWGSGGGGGGSVSVTVSSGSQLYVSGNSRSTLLSYNDANNVSGSTAANRIVVGGVTTLNGPRGIAIDMPRNRIYIANFAGNSILAFNNARTVTGDSKGNPTGTRLDNGHRSHTDPRGQGPHAHRPGVTNPDGTEWLPVQK